MSLVKKLSRPWSSSNSVMKPFFGASNRLACILISLIIFGYAIYCIINDGIFSSEYFQFIKLKTAFGGSKERSIRISYNFDSVTAPLFGLYEIEIAFIKVCVSVLLFIILLVGAAQRSKILLRIWMMIHSLVIILGFLATLILITDSHLQNNGIPTHTLTKFLITLAFGLWFFAVVLSLHEEIEYEETAAPVVFDEPSIISGSGRITPRNCTYIAKTRVMERIPEEKSPPYYDC